MLLLAVVPLSFLHAAESAVWDTANSTVTYSTTVSGIALGGGALQVNLSQFSSAAAASEEGGSAAQYTLSQVVLSIDGTICGNIYFHNTGTATVTPSFRVGGGESSLAFGSHVTGTDTIATRVTFLGDGYFSSAGTSSETVISVLGAANVSGTYEYVHEPSSLALLGFVYAAR